MMSGLNGAPRGKGAPLLRVHLLGPFQMFVGGKEVPKERWKSKKALTLFQYLLTRRGTKVHKESVLELLWPDENPMNSSNKLHSTVYMLRRMLQPTLRAYQDTSYIRHAHGMYWLESGDSCWVDTDEFERLCHESEAMEEIDRPGSRAMYEQALALYRGDFLPEETFEDWAANPRERYRELYIDVTLRASHLMMELGDNVTEAVRLCRDALTHDPYREEVHQAIMNHLINAGRYAEAAAQYRTCTEMLYEEFGLTPSPETKALYEKMKQLAGESGAAGLEFVAPNTDTEGPVVCNRRTFDTIHSLFLRQQQRDGRPISLLEITPVAQGVTDKQRTAIMKMLSSTLRQGDTLCWDDGQALVLLNVSKEGCDVVRRRIQRLSTQERLPSVIITTRVFEMGALKSREATSPDPRLRSRAH